VDEDDEDYEDFGEDDDYEYGESGHFGLPVGMLPFLACSLLVCQRHPQWQKMLLLLLCPQQCSQC